MGKENQFDSTGNTQFPEKLFQHVIERGLGQACLLKDLVIAATLRDKLKYSSFWSGENYSEHGAPPHRS